jgi:peptide/nickel transport system substrate-binding protein
LEVFMTARSRRRPTPRALALLLLPLVAAAVLSAPVHLEAAETPRRGGVLLAVIGADAPSLDAHQESTFATLQMVAPLYSTLVQIDPYSYPKIIGDAATEWRIAPDGLTYTFKIRQGIRFHDGPPLTAADVKATYDKIIFPPDGVRSIRRNAYSAVASVEAPDPSTVVFKLKAPSASLLDNLASPWNVIYPKKYLDKDPNYFKANAVGSGPFKFKGYTRGATFEGERNSDYFVKDRPYLNGYKFFISPETSVRAAAIRSGRAYIEFRDLPSSEVDAIKKQLGDKVVVQQTPMVGQFGIGMQNTVKPFNDIRVRKALTLAIDRYTAGRVLFPLTGLRDVGGLMRPGTEWALPEAELQKLPGFGKDMEKNRAEAKRLLAEAGFPNGFKTVLKNRNVRLPYQDFAVYVIQEWRKIGIEVENRPLETAAWFADLRDTGNFELGLQPTVEYMDDPDIFLRRYTTGDSSNYGRFTDPALDDLFSRQARALDAAERRKLVHQLQKMVLENAYYMPGLWWTRNVVHWAKVKNYVAPPSHYTNQKLQDVWLSED